jgi:serine/threonine protein kinase/tetratricopeptide (TPR) repeat protein
VDAKYGASDLTRIGPYRLIKLLGAGGMGRVYLGKSAGGRRVAVKVIRPELAADQEFRARFRREVEAARRVNGLYTAHVVDADATGRMPWLATAYIDAPSLDTTVHDQGPLSPAAARALAAALAEGLSKIHAVGLVHRDLKPSNVLLASDGPRIIDFGIARTAEATLLTLSGSFMGTPGYMSPEQARDGGKVGPASDIFSLGALIYYAATGNGPWGFASAEAIVHRILHDRPDIRGLPSDLYMLVNRCMEKDPAKRPTLTAILARFGDPELIADGRMALAKTSRPGARRESAMPSPASTVRERDFGPEAVSLAQAAPSRTDTPEQGSSAAWRTAPRSQGRRREAAGLSPAQVPAEPFGFAARTAELDWLQALLPKPPRETGAQPPSCPVVLITGTAGVGKTTLAIRFARLTAPRFPDGQLYVNLRGFDPASGPVSPRTALQGFFDALGVPQKHVPAALEAQSALFRSLLGGKRVLLLLDNAHDADQVRPLLPAGSNCMAVVTSRSQLTGLVVAYGARPLALDVLDAHQGAELLAERLGSDRVSAEPDAVATLVQQSAGLPLALSVACARAILRPRARLADLAAELADTRGRLDALRTGEVSTDLRAVFSWSVDKLSDQAAQTFRLLGLHPGPDITAAATASLTAVTLPQARDALAELARASLLTEDPVGRFGCHDLLRAYAAEQATALGDADCDLARRRVVDHYLQTAYAAATTLYPGRGSVAIPATLDGVVAEQFTGDGAYEAALAWFTTEHQVLQNLLGQAAVHGDDEFCWKLAWYWVPYLQRHNRLHEAIAIQEPARRAADRLGDTDALAHVHYDLGLINVRLGDYRVADENLRRSLELFTGLSDQAAIGQVQHGFTILLHSQGRYEEALEHAVEALRLRRSFADRATVAYAENGLGWIQAHLGQHDEALRHCYLALEMHRESGSRSGAADTLDSIAFIHGERADYGQSVSYYEQSIAEYRLVGDLHGEARGLVGLGDTQLAAGQTDAAMRSWEHALALLSQIPGADTSEASERIARHEHPPDNAAQLLEDLTE